MRGYGSAMVTPNGNNPLPTTPLSGVPANGFAAKRQGMTAPASLQTPLPVTSTSELPQFNNMMGIPQNTPGAPQRFAAARPGLQQPPMGPLSINPATGIAMPLPLPDPLPPPGNVPPVNLDANAVKGVPVDAQDIGPEWGAYRAMGRLRDLTAIMGLLQQGLDPEANPPKSLQSDVDDLISAVPDNPIDRVKRLFSEGPNALKNRAKFRQLTTRFQELEKIIKQNDGFLNTQDDVNALITARTQMDVANYLVNPALQDLVSNWDNSPQKAIMLPNGVEVTLNPAQVQQVESRLTELKDAIKNQQAPPGTTLETLIQNDMEGANNDIQGRPTLKAILDDISQNQIAPNIMQEMGNVNTDAQKTLNAMRSKLEQKLGMSLEEAEKKLASVEAEEARRAEAAQAEKAEKKRKQPSLSQIKQGFQERASDIATRPIPDAVSINNLSPEVIAPLKKSLDASAQINREIEALYQQFNADPKRQDRVRQINGLVATFHELKGLPNNLVEKLSALQKEEAQAQEALKKKVKALTEKQDSLGGPLKQELKLALEATDNARAEQTIAQATADWDKLIKDVSQQIQDTDTSDIQTIAELMALEDKLRLQKEQHLARLKNGLNAANQTRDDRVEKLALVAKTPEEELRKFDSLGEAVDQLMQMLADIHGENNVTQALNVNDAAVNRALEKHQVGDLKGSHSWGATTPTKLQVGLNVLFNSNYSKAVQESRKLVELRQKLDEARQAKDLPKTYAIAKELLQEIDKYVKSPGEGKDPKIIAMLKGQQKLISDFIHTVTFIQSLPLYATGGGSVVQGITGSALKEMGTKSLVFGTQMAITNSLTTDATNRYVDGVGRAHPELKNVTDQLQQSTLGAGIQGALQGALMPVIGAIGNKAIGGIANIANSRGLLPGFQRITINGVNKAVPNHVISKFLMGSATQANSLFGSNLGAALLTEVIYPSNSQIPLNQRLNKIFSESTSPEALKTLAWQTVAIKLFQALPVKNSIRPTPKQADALKELDLKFNPGDKPLELKTVVESLNKALDNANGDINKTTRAIKAYGELVGMPMEPQALQGEIAKRQAALKTLHPDSDAAKTLVAEKQLYELLEALTPTKDVGADVNDRLARLTTRPASPSQPPVLSPEKLFPSHEGLIFQQGNTGDCYVLAAIGAIAKKPGGIDHLRSLIKPVNEPGGRRGYEVTFPGEINPKTGEPYKIFVEADGKHKSQGEKRLAQDMGNPGISILERAYGRLLKEVEQHRLSTASSTDTLIIMESGDPGVALQRMTGGTPYKFKINLPRPKSDPISYTGSEKPDELAALRQKAAANLQRIQEFNKAQLIANLEELGAMSPAELQKFNITASSKGTSDRVTLDPEGKIPGRHAFTVESIDPKTRTITLINPHNYDGVMKSAKITLTFEEFAQYFRAVDAVTTGPSGN